MRRDVIAVGVGDKRQLFPVPRLEPKIPARQEDTAIVTHVDHQKLYLRNGSGETGIRAKSMEPVENRPTCHGVPRLRFAPLGMTLIWRGIDSAPQFPFRDSDEACDGNSFGPVVRRWCPRGGGRGEGASEGES